MYKSQNPHGEYVLLNCELSSTLEHPMRSISDVEISLKAGIEKTRVYTELCTSATSSDYGEISVFR